MMETDYLLQRIEGYTGAVILATNLRQQIDEAFLRRFHAVVEFPFPDAEQREQLWTRAVAARVAEAARADLVNVLTEGRVAEDFSFSGADIDQIVDRAELLAVRRRGVDAQITSNELRVSIREQLTKQGKALI
jgi:SpoVK/Ycf46/Vps4 family AAA+-type ATPase